MDEVVGHNLQRVSADPQLTGEVVSPRFIIDDTTSRVWTADPEHLGYLLETEYYMSPDDIAKTTIIADSRPRLSYKGSHMPKSVDRLLHGTHPENEGEGAIIRVGTRYRGHQRTIEEVNQTFAHEAEHAAQQYRKDPKLLLGNIAIWGLTAAGAYAGSKLKSRSRVATMLLGAAIGHQTGYRLAPHEREARKKADRVHVAALKPKRD